MAVLLFYKAGHSDHFILVFKCVADHLTHFYFLVENGGTDFNRSETVGGKCYIQALGFQDAGHPPLHLRNHYREENCCFPGACFKDAPLCPWLSRSIPPFQQALERFDVR